MLQSNYRLHSLRQELEQQLADTYAELAGARKRLAAADEQAAALTRKGTALARLQRLPAEVQSLKVRLFVPCWTRPNMARVLQV